MYYLKEFLRWLYWYPFRYFIQTLPPRYMYLIGKIGGEILYHIPGKRNSLRQELVDNILDNADEGEIEEILRETLRGYFQMKLEVLVYPKLNRENINRYVRYQGLEHLDEALLQNKGVILLFGHYGANQMIMPAIGYRGYTMNQLSAPSTVLIDKLAEDKLTPMRKKKLQIQWEHEASLPVKHINVFGSLKEVFYCLQRNEILGVAIDGGAGKDKIPFKFLKKKALFLTGVMGIALKTGSTVIPTFMVRGEDGMNTLILEKPLELTKSDNAKESKIENTKLFVKQLEEYVYRHPSHYLHFLLFRWFMADKEHDPFFVE